MTRGMRLAMTRISLRMTRGRIVILSASEESGYWCGRVVHSRLVCLQLGQMLRCAQHDRCYAPHDKGEGPPHDRCFAQHDKGEGPPHDKDFAPHDKGEGPEHDLVLFLLGHVLFLLGHLMELARDESEHEGDNYGGIYIHPHRIVDESPLERLPTHYSDKADFCVRTGCVLFLLGHLMELARDESEHEGDNYGGIYIHPHRIVDESPEEGGEEQADNAGHGKLEMRTPFHQSISLPRYSFTPVLSCAASFQRVPFRAIRVWPACNRSGRASVSPLRPHDNTLFLL